MSLPVGTAVSAVAASAAPAALSRALTIGRGGAAAAVAAAGLSSAAASKLADLSGGASSAASKAGAKAKATSSASAKSAPPAPADDGSRKILGILRIPAEGRAVLSMAAAMATHYLAYSLARPSTLALFTSGRTGFAGMPSAYPFAMGFVSPTSLALLMMYGKVLDGRGPRAALRLSTLYCAAVLGAAAAVVTYMESAGLHVSALPYVRAVVGALFVFRESYVQLITSQHWSFMGSVLSPAQSSTWFAPISGLTSTSSALAGMAVAKIVDAVGLTGTLGAAAATLALSAAFAERAYGISERYGFNPADEHDAEKAKEAAKAAKPGAGTKKGAAAVVVAEKPPGMIKKASDLFARVPVLKSLFVEILACQGLSTILNVCYVNKLSTTIEDDRERAGWSGKFFAVINLVSGFLQFAVLPPLMSVIEPAALWRAMPLIMMAFTAYLGVDDDPTLVLVAGTFLAMKAMEFSARRMLDEMVYVPLDFDSRYVGKEVIGVFGYRFGKSGMSLALSALTSSDLGNLGLRQLTWLTTAAAAVWLRFTWRLSNQVLTREEAQRAYEEKRKATAAGGAKGAKKGKK